MLLAILRKKRTADFFFCFSSPSPSRLLSRATSTQRLGGEGGTCRGGGGVCRAGWRAEPNVLIAWNLSTHREISTTLRADRSADEEEEKKDLETVHITPTRILTVE